MIELPEAAVLARQAASVWTGRTICEAVAGQTRHGFAWYSGDPATYAERLEGRKVLGTESRGGHVWIRLSGGSCLMFGEGACMRCLAKGEAGPKKHQVLVSFDDETRLVVTVHMYAFLGLDDGTTPLSPYQEGAMKACHPLDESFDAPFFTAMARAADTGKLTVKGLLATEQRIPGLGNGVLQDILYRAGLHPKRTVAGLSDGDLAGLLLCMQEVLAEMLALGGRDTEKDLFGSPGGYATKLSRFTVGKPCRTCGTEIRKEAYMGGSIYFCPLCQPLP